MKSLLAERSALLVLSMDIPRVKSGVSGEARLVDSDGEHVVIDEAKSTAGPKLREGVR